MFTTKVKCVCVQNNVGSTLAVFSALNAEGNRQIGKIELQSDVQDDATFKAGKTYELSFTEQAEESAYAAEEKKDEKSETAD